MISESKLADWSVFLMNKGYNTEVRETANDGQPVYYSLWRSLSDQEISQLNSGRLKIKNNFLEYAADNSSKRRGSYK
jgi:hypothetical protein